jgi:rRNA maturation endonuclease Nob1
MENVLVCQECGKIFPEWFNGTKCSECGGYFKVVPAIKEKVLAEIRDVKHKKFSK